jgi:hypothetical protein
LRTRRNHERPKQGIVNRRVFQCSEKQYRELIEQVASDTFDAGVNVDEAGWILVTKEALDRVRIPTASMRSF